MYYLAEMLIRTNIHSERFKPLAMDIGGRFRQIVHSFVFLKYLRFGEFSFDRKIIHVLLNVIKF